MVCAAILSRRLSPITASCSFVCTPPLLGTVRHLPAGTAPVVGRLSSGPPLLPSPSPPPSPPPPPAVRRPSPACVTSPPSTFLYLHVSRWPLCVSFAPPPLLPSAFRHLLASCRSPIHCTPSPQPALLTYPLFPISPVRVVNLLFVFVNPFDLSAYPSRPPPARQRGLHRSTGLATLKVIQRSVLFRARTPSPLQPSQPATGTSPAPTPLSVLLPWTRCHEGELNFRTKHGRTPSATVMTKSTTYFLSVVAPEDFRPMVAPMRMLF